MAGELNVFQNPPPKIRLGQDMKPEHWSQGRWVFVEGEDWEYNAAEDIWEYSDGYWSYEKGNYWIYVESSNVRAIRYDIDAQQLFVWFNSGRVYQYSQVDEPTALRMFHANSMGKFVHQVLIGNVEGKFSALRIK